MRRAICRLDAGSRARVGEFMTAFTPQQQSALESAYQILGEHFDGSLIVVLTECGDDKPQEAVRVYWHGGRLQALGMCEDAKDRILRKEPDNVQE